MTAKEHEHRAYVLEQGEGRVIAVPSAGGRVTMKAEGHQTGEVITLYESRHEPHAIGPARHYHTRYTELFYVLEGTYEFVLGDEVHHTAAGSTVVIPPGNVHAFCNAGNEPGRLLIMVLPGGFEGFFDAAKELSSPMEDATRWREINETWDAHVVGPPLGVRPQQQGEDSAS
jgi:quercetin dioxygenase-like cupin family protein